MRRQFVVGFAFVAASVLAACGGGGSPGPNPPTGGGGSTATPSPTPPPAVTTASGKVVSDIDGSNLAGVNVALRPWTACTAVSNVVSCPTPLPAPQATTAADGSFTLTNAPNGHYFLVIGDDTAGSTTTTVHANVTFTGGTVALAAPTMPPFPTITPNPWETNGDYRIKVLDATTEAPCFARVNADRITAGLPKMVEDEWLLENSRQLGVYVENPAFHTAPYPNNANGILAASYDLMAGGTSCSLMVDGAFAVLADPLNNPLVEWYGGYRDPLVGREQEMSDPATAAMPPGVTWP